MQLLREQTPRLSDSRREQLWRAVQRGPTPAAEPARAGWGLLRLPAWMGASALAFAATLVLALWLWPAPSPKTPTPWVAEGRGPLRPGQELQVPPGAPVVLRSDRETVVAAGGSLLRLPTDNTGELRLQRGELRIQTHRGQHSRLTVRLGALRVRPLGTAYRLRWPAAGLQVAVDRGQVEVRSDDGKRVILRAGQGLHWGRDPRRLTTAERRELAASWGRTVVAVAAARLVAPPVAPATAQSPMLARVVPTTAKPSVARGPLGGAARCSAHARFTWLLRPSKCEA